MLSVETLKDVLFCDSPVVSEIAAKYRVKAEEVAGRVDLDRLLAELRAVGPHDRACARFEFDVRMDVPRELDAKSSDADVAALAGAMDECVADGGVFDVTVQVDKGLSREGRYTVYCLDAFSDFVAKWRFADIVSTLNDAVCNYGCGPRILDFPNDAGAALELDGIDASGVRDVIVSKRKGVCSIDGFERLRAVPQDLHVSRCEGIGDCVVERLGSACAMISLAYLSNRSVIEADSLSFVMRGTAEVSDTVSASDKALEDDGAYRLCRWVYDGGEVFDKVELARNILCLHAREAGVLPVGDDELSAIQGSYSVYLKESAKEYLAARERLSATMCEYCDRVADCIVDYAGDFRKNLVAILGYVSAMLFSKAISGSADFFTGAVVQVSAAILVVSFTYGIVTLVFYCRRVAYYGKSLRALCEDLDDVFGKGEPARLVDGHSQWQRAREHFRTWAIVLTVLWVVTCAVSYLLLDWISGVEPPLFGLNIFP